MGIISSIKHIFDHGGGDSSAPPGSTPAGIEADRVADELGDLVPELDAEGTWVLGQDAVAGCITAETIAHTYRELTAALRATTPRAGEADVRRGAYLLTRQVTEGKLALEDAVWSVQSLRRQVADNHVHYSDYRAADIATIVINAPGAMPGSTTLADAVRVLDQWGPRMSMDPAVAPLLQRMAAGEINIPAFNSTVNELIELLPHTIRLTDLLQLTAAALDNGWSVAAVVNTFEQSRIAVGKSTPTYGVNEAAERTVAIIRG